jgi:hypothetical protein
MIPQPASDGTTSARHSLKQGVVRVPVVKQIVIMSDGREVPYEELSQTEKNRLAQKFMDELITPLAYELVMKDMEREQKAAN